MRDQGEEVVAMSAKRYTVWRIVRGFSCEFEGEYETYLDAYVAARTITSGGDDAVIERLDAAGNARAQESFGAYEDPLEDFDPRIVRVYAPREEDRPEGPGPADP
jgi:hypothetical protein